MGRLKRLDVGGAFATPTIRSQFIFNALVLVEGAQSSCFNGRHMDESIIATVVGRDEAKAFGVVEELYGTLRHFVTFR